MAGISRVTDAKCVITVGPFDFDVTYSAYYDPGVTSGPIDRCYPPEEELDVTDIKYCGEDVTALLSESALEQIEAKAWEDANATWSDRCDDQADALYDAWREEQERRCE